MPCSVEWFLERAGLVYYNQGVSGCGEVDDGFLSVPGGVRELLPAGQVTQEKLLQVQAQVPQPEHLSLTLERQHYHGQDRHRLNEVPIYVHAKLVQDQVHGRPEAYEINYITYYAFNGHYAVPFGLPIFMTGHHVGDWEHLTVRLDARTLELQGVWYNAHRNIEGEWCPAARVPRTRCGRIIGHVAINGHGIYPHCGVIPRLFFAANDRTSRSGPVWNPACIVRMCGVSLQVDPRHLCHAVRSRGCSLPLPQAMAAAPEPPSTLRSTDAAGADAGSAVSAAADAAQVQLEQQRQQQQRQPSSPLQTSDMTALANSAEPMLTYALPEVVHDSSPWQRFEGRWGTVVGPMHQGWFNYPEPPLSRGLLKRLFLPSVLEGFVVHLPRGLQRAPAMDSAATAVTGEALLQLLCQGPTQHPARPHLLGNHVGYPAPPGESSPAAGGYGGYPPAQPSSLPPSPPSPPPLGSAPSPAAGGAGGTCIDDSMCGANSCCTGTMSRPGRCITAALGRGGICPGSGGPDGPSSQPNVPAPPANPAPSANPLSTPSSSTSSTSSSTGVCAASCQQCRQARVEGLGLGENACAPATSPLALPPAFTREPRSDTAALRRHGPGRHGAGRHRRGDQVRYYQAPQIDFTKLRWVPIAANVSAASGAAPTAPGAVTTITWQASLAAVRDVHTGGLQQLDPEPWFEGLNGLFATSDPAWVPPPEAPAPPLSPDEDFGAALPPSWFISPPPDAPLPPDRYPTMPPWPPLTPERPPWPPMVLLLPPFSPEAPPATPPPPEQALWNGSPPDRLLLQVPEAPPPFVPPPADDDAPEPEEGSGLPPAACPRSSLRLAVAGKCPRSTCPTWTARRHRRACSAWGAAAAAAMTTTTAASAGGASSWHRPRTHCTPSFTPCCDAHDTCYGACAANGTRARCDGGLLGCALRACAASGDAAAAQSQRECVVLAHAYYQASSNWGAPAWADAQDDYCECDDASRPPSPAPPQPAPPTPPQLPAGKPGKARQNGLLLLARPAKAATRLTVSSSAGGGILSYRGGVRLLKPRREPLTAVPSMPGPPGLPGILSRHRGLRQHQQQDPLPPSPGSSPSSSSTTTTAATTTAAAASSSSTSYLLSPPILSLPRLAAACHALLAAAGAGPRGWPA
ncbi:hypothetical protein HYH02_006151 [Chlamydomonas schloesseri]|uniref:Uncharacterized protein n=1 Tax=Chlamydomonas schloesseri TaxID=2026947 RepID=A0A835WL50_9CHLO|nr:hypothetical protein HYH02_006151 [Chlamydomonas schloesseri]|eukprot:KAG2448800.1 hypothetical protein HYH02_006151 [Chlamydomonas schloesseri]